MPHLSKQIRLRRDFPGHIVVVNVENFEVLQAVELRGEAEIEDVVGEVKVAEIGDVGDLGRHGSGEGIGSNREVNEKAQATDVRGEDACEAQVGDIK